MENMHNKHDERICLLSLLTFPACFIGVFFLVGVMILGFGIHSAYFGEKSISWPTTDGHLYQCYLKEEHFTSKNGNYTSWSANVEYSYTVEGKSFVSRQLSFGSNSSTVREKQQELCNMLEKSSRVTVHYQPENPSNAVLIAGTDKNSAYYIIFGIILLLILAVAGWDLIWPIYTMRKAAQSGKLQIRQKNDASKRSCVESAAKRNDCEKLNTPHRAGSLFLISCQIGLAGMLLLILAIVIGILSSYIYTEQIFFAWPAVVMYILSAVAIGTIWYIMKIINISSNIHAKNTTSPCIYNILMIISSLLMIIYFGMKNTCMLLFSGVFFGFLVRNYFFYKKVDILACCRGGYFEMLYRQTYIQYTVFLF